MSENTVTLRVTEPDDYPTLKTWLNDYAVADGFRASTDILPDDEAERLLHERSDRDDEHQFGRTVIGPRGLVIGHVSASGCTDPDRSAVLGVLIGPYFQDHGYGSAALRLAIQLAASQLGAVTVTVKVWAFNLRARHMCESLGFAETGRRNDVVERDGRRYDEVIYSAPTAALTARISQEEQDRERGEALELQRFEVSRAAEHVAVL
ncbi:GNAT family N-acetyltransferase [Bifidobacterium moraviense]|nr:GNAT family protein [Bifidobacterium sp. DSM 109958]